MEVTADMTLADDSRVTYAEVRQWVRWLDTFTASELADVMAVSLEVAQRGILAALWHGIVKVSPETYGGEEIVSYIPAPHEIHNYPKRIPPERAVGYVEVLCPRGMPVRIRTDGESRHLMSTSGSRAKYMRRERAWQRQEEAKRRRAQKQRERALVAA